MRYKKTKNALLLSLLSMLTCLSMLLGSTFAWFTDNATTGVSLIRSGNLDVELVNGDNDLPLTGGLDFVNKDGSADILWEPGARFTTRAFRVKNNGDLWLKYRVSLTGIDGDQALLKVLDWSIDQAASRSAGPTAEYTLAPNQTSPLITITAHMDENAGNVYQGLTLNGVQVLVQAAQAAGESDSYGPNYDADAGYDTGDAPVPPPSALSVWDGSIESVPKAVDGVITITSAAQLAGLAQELASNVNTNDLESMMRYRDVTVKLAADIDLNGRPWTPIGSMDLVKMTGAFFSGSFDGQGHTISNLSINTEAGSQGLFGMVSCFYYSDESQIKFGKQVFQDLTIHNAQITSAGSQVGAFIGDASGSEFTLSGLKLTGDVKIEGSADVGGIVGYLNTNRAVSSALKDITVDAASDSYVRSTQRDETRDAQAGGVAGSLTRNTMENVSSNIDVSGYSYNIGGITGRTGGCTWSNVHSSGNVSAESIVNESLRYRQNGLLVGYVATIDTGSNTFTCSFTKCTASGALKIGDKTGNEVIFSGVENNNRFGSCSNSNYLVIQD